MKAFGKCAAAVSIDIAPDRGLRAFPSRVDIVAAHERETEERVCGNGKINFSLDDRTRLRHETVILRYDFFFSLRKE